MGRSDDLNEERMRLLARQFGQQSFVQRVDTFPPEKPDRVIAHFYASHYPDPISAVRLELRLLLSGDYNLYYQERWDGSVWECRWDRHDNSHNDREHFHPPPDIDETTPVDATLSVEPNDLIECSFRFLDDRRAALWESAPEIVYPREYRYEWDYGPEVRQLEE